MSTEDTYIVEYAKMNPDIKKKWLRKLRSGDYEQGQQYLRQEEDDGSQLFCCLGVLCDIVEPDKWIADTVLLGKNKWAHHACNIAMPANDVLQACLLSQAAAKTLASKNDNGKSFERIADWIEENL